ncbi:MAG TPA: hypothetical protein VMB50_03715 [Myxococcales bacterium]|nr:hypothetical protein [Myxococcales bacterium]
MKLLQRILVAAAFGAIAGCGSSPSSGGGTSGGTSGGSQGCTIFQQDWGLATCPAGDFCPDELALIGDGYGASRMTIQFANANDGVECDFFANFTEGSSNSQGTGSFDQAVVSGTLATSTETSECTSLDNKTFTWTATCSQLTLTDSSGTSTYNVSN